MKYILLAASVIVTVAGVYRALGEESGFRQSLLDYIERHSDMPRVDSIPGDDEIHEAGDANSGEFRYERGDWSKYIVEDHYTPSIRTAGERQIEIAAGENANIVSYGSMKMNLLYGKSVFTSDRYRLFDQDKPVSKIIQSGFYPERELQIHVEGNVGKRLKLYIDHDSRKSDNRYMMKYSAEEDEEVIREINAGEIDIKMPGSKWVVFDDSTQKGLGVDVSMKRKGLRVKAFGTVTRGEAVVEQFRGNASAGGISLGDYQYLRGKYYQIESFKRYDNLSAPPTDATAYSLITFTSSPSSPENYSPYAVNVDASSFELYLDDQDPQNNFNAIGIPIDDGSYVKMSSGSDYTVNFTTGLVTVHRAIPDNSRMFAVYTLNGGSVVSSDNTARTDVFPGKIFVYIKYGYSINEDLNRDFVQDIDRNNDGKMNLDIYEVRSTYSIGEKRVLDENFKIDFYHENSLLTRAETVKTGRYSVDPSNGIVMFRLREPFRSLLGGLSSQVYNEAILRDTYLSSRYSLKIQYFREARSFQLRYTNIIPDSLRIRVNGREISSSLYSVDYTSGFLEFTDPNNPMIGAQTDIEIRYEYLPFAGESQSFIAGVRADYDLGRNIDIGGTVVFSRGSGGLVIPKAGSEPEQLLIFEGDVSLYLGQKRLKDIINSLPGVDVKSAPFEFRGYAEYAKSYRDINTFGKALIDDMESGDEVVSVSLSERDWMLSAPPSDLVDGLPVMTQGNRGLLHYLYYRSLGSAEMLRGLSFTPYIILYGTKPGPYNVSAGHLERSIQSQEDQLSLALDFDFSGGKDFTSIVTRRLSSKAVDFSGLQYVEIWYRSTGGSGSVDLFLDIGRVNEDSDGDGILDTEDLNNNGFLDSDPSRDYFEDRGYTFNPSGGVSTRVGSGPGLNSFTLGDGALNSEDLNGNGIMDSLDRVVRFPGNATTPYTSAAGSRFSVDMADTSWRMIRIYLDRSSVGFTADSERYQDILRQVESIRLFAVHNTADTGVVLIDRISFVSSRWRNIKLDGIPFDSPKEFSVTLVDTHNDDEYRSDAFIFREPGIYKSLHGEKSSSELAAEKESAISVKYDLSMSSSGSVTRKFQTNIDMRFYRTLNMWFNFKEFTPGDSVAVILGSSENNYIEFGFPVENKGVWREMTFKLQNGSGGSLEKSRIVGNPDMKRINFIEVVIYGDSGRFWLNDIYVSDSETLKDSAYWIEGVIKSKRALWRTASGIPVISDLQVKYILKGHGAQFGSVGKTVNDMSERYHQLFSSVKILPNWSAVLDFTSESTKTDSLNENVSDGSRGKAGRRSIYVESFYASETPYVPSIKVIYKHDDHENIRDEFLSDNAMTVKNSGTSRSPTLWVEERMEEFLGGTLVATFQMNTVFREEEVHRKSSNLSNEDLSSYVSLREMENRQKGNLRISMDYRSDNFFCLPVIDMGSQEIVRLSGRGELTDTKILSDIDGGFHFPLIYRGDYRFVERNRNLDLKMGFRNLGIIAPTYGLNMYYLENRFRDYNETEKLISGDFSRARDARSFISYRLDIPISVSDTGLPGFIRSFNIGFNRSVFFQETDAPYEGEGYSELDEDYGMRRAYGVLAGKNLNLMKYHPFYFLAGRGNFARGRDYVYNTLNDGIVFSGGNTAGEYSNSMRHIDSVSLSTSAGIGPAEGNLSLGLNNVCERSSLYGIPRQVVSLTASTGISFDLMRTLRTGFFRPNASGLPHHSSTLSPGYGYSKNMLITSNITEEVHSPNLGIVFKRDRASLGFKGGIDYRLRKDKEFIPIDAEERSRSDDIYFGNMSNQVPFSEKDLGYRFSAFFETDVLWLYNFFLQFYTLTAHPVFSMEYSLLLNRYDYTVTVSPEPYDQHLVSGKLTLDLHRNIQGGLTGRWALEKFRNRDSDGIYREIMSYELGMNFTLLF